MKITNKFLWRALAVVLIATALRIAGFELKGIMAAVFAGCGVYVFMLAASFKPKDEAKPVFRGKETTFCLCDGPKVIGTAESEPGEWDEYVILADARIIDERATIPGEEVYTKLAIPTGTIQTFGLVNLDRV